MLMSILVEVTAIKEKILSLTDSVGLSYAVGKIQEDVKEFVKAID